MKKQEAREILGVKESDDESKIKKAYRKLALKNHPDKNKGSEESKRKFQQISEAYKCLTDPKYMDENMDGMDGFSMDEEELFAMFNMMFGFGDDVFGGDGLHMGGDMFDLFSFMDDLGGQSDAGFFGNNPGGFFGGAGIDLPNVEDLNPEEMREAEKYVNSGDEEGLFLYLNQLKVKIDKRKKRSHDRFPGRQSTKASRADNNATKLKSTSRMLNKDSSDESDSGEDSDDTRAEFEAFASMMGIPSHVAKQMLKEEKKGKKSSSAKSSKAKSSKRRGRFDADEDLDDEAFAMFAAMMGMPSSMAGPGFLSKDLSMGTRKMGRGSELSRADEDMAAMLEQMDVLNFEKGLQENYFKDDY